MRKSLEEKLEKKLKKSFGPSVDEQRLLALAEKDAAVEWERDVAAGLPFEPDRGYWDAYDKWVGAFNPKTLAIADRAMREMEKAKKDLLAIPSDVSPDDPRAVDLANRFRANREAAHKAILRNPPSREEWQRSYKTPSQMNASGSLTRTIAAEWNWKNEDDRPDLARVQRELDSPGSELTEAAWAARYEWHLLQMGFVYVATVDEDAPPVQAKPRVPEVVKFASIEDLVRQRVPVAQIVATKVSEYGIDREDQDSKPRIQLVVDAVYAVGAALGITLPANSRQLILAGRKEFMPASFAEPEPAGVL